jgi:hypothetical protein
MMPQPRDGPPEFTIKFGSVAGMTVKVQAENREDAVKKGKREWYATIPEPTVISIKP